MTGTALTTWINRVRAAERGGDLLIAHDLANRGLAEHPDSVDLRYLATRTLARSGAYSQAATLYRKFRLDRERDLDVAALGARIAKDIALNATTGRSAALRAAAAHYARLYRGAGDHYPAINAATLYMLAGDGAAARRYARHAVGAARSARSRNRLDSYYRAATEAEACLVLDDSVAARQALQRAARFLGRNFDAGATTRRQLRLICDAKGLGPDIIDILRMPTVAHYHGPSPSTVTDARAISAAFAQMLLDRRVGYVFGSLTAGREILFAEAALAAGAELHVVLPFDQGEFIAMNARHGGREWRRRFNACLGRAKSVTFATSDSFQGDRRLFSYACRLGMGMATLRANYLDSEVRHFRLQPAGADPDPDGYAQNLKLWKATNGPVEIVKAGADDASRTAPGAVGTPRNGSARGRVPRVTRALLFGDVKGYSKVPDALVPAFQKRLMGPIARALGRYRRHVLHRNSWGDAIYAVIDDPVVAADCCLAIQKAVVGADPAKYGLPAGLSLRLAAHFGPVYEIHDPVLDEANFFGTHTTMTARMEPVTAPGEVYVTEAMAASIAMSRAAHLRAESVGVVPMAKGYGAMRMYRLSAATPTSRRAV